MEKDLSFFDVAYSQTDIVRLTIGLIEASESFLVVAVEGDDIVSFSTCGDEAHRARLQSFVSQNIKAIFE